MRSGTQDKLSAIRSGSRDTLDKMRSRSSVAKPSLFKKPEDDRSPKVGARIEWGQFRSPESRSGVITKVKGHVVTVRTDQGEEEIDLRNKSLTYNIMPEGMREDDDVYKRKTPFGYVTFRGARAKAEKNIDLYGNPYGPGGDDIKGRDPRTAELHKKQDLEWDREREQHKGPYVVPSTRYGGDSDADFDFDDDEGDAFSNVVKFYKNASPEQRKEIENHPDLKANPEQLKKLKQAAGVEETVAASPRLQRAHDEERRRRGLPHPDEYLRMIEKKKKEIADMRAQDLEDKKKGVAEGPFTGIGKMMMKHKLKKGIRQDQDDEDDAFDNMHDYDFDDELRFGHEDEFAAAYDAKRRKEKALARLSRKSVSEGQKVDEPYMDKVISSLHKDALGFRPDHEFGREWMSSSFEEKQKIYYNLLSLLDNDMDEDVSEGKKDSDELAKYENDVKTLLANGDVKTAKKVAGLSPDAAHRNHLRNIIRRHDSKQGVAEGSDFGEPQEILEDVLRVLEREVEWPLTDVMDPREVKQLLAPIVKAVNDKLMKMMKMGEAYGRRNNYYNPLEYERGQQRQMDYEKQAFKRAELQHELGHEDDPDFERKLRDKDRGPWYIRIDGKIYKQKGEPKMFDWKKGANNYALAILKNKPELQGKILITKNPADK